MNLRDFTHARSAILGAGREGQAAHAWLRRAYPFLPLTMVCETPPDAGFVATLGPADQLWVEPLTATRLAQFDILIRSPGISLYRAPLQQARASGVQITTPTSLWFAAHPDARTLCVTGTKGKSTTAALLAHMLRWCGGTVRLAGNIGRALLACPDEAVDWWVIELSSYQVADLQAAPSIALMLNLSPEHLDWHGGEQAYLRDKSRLVDLTLAGGGWAVINAADAECVSRFGHAQGVSWFNTEAGICARDDGLFDAGQRLPVVMPEGLPGAHNRSNVAAALAAVAAAGGAVRQAAAAVESFQCLPHRLQVLGYREGVRCINDSIASTPLATAAALASLAGQNVVLIVGGLDRGLDWSRYRESFLQYLPKAVVAVPDSGQRILDMLAGMQVNPPAGCHMAEGLDQAVRMAHSLCTAGDTLLLSPGAPSFPRFVDYQDRGQTFAGLCGLSIAAGDLAGLCG